MVKCHFCVVVNYRKTRLISLFSLTFGLLESLCRLNSCIAAHNVVAFGAIPQLFMRLVHRQIHNTFFSCICLWACQRFWLARYPMLPVKFLRSNNTFQLYQFNFLQVKVEVNNWENIRKCKTTPSHSFYTCIAVTQAEMSPMHKCCGGNGAVTHTSICKFSKTPNV